MPYRIMLKHRPVRTIGYLLCFVAGVVFFAQDYDGPFRPGGPVVLEATDELTVHIWSLMLIFGGLLAAFGHYRHKSAIEESGLSLLIGALAVYAIAAVAMSNPIIGGPMNSRLALGVLLVGIALVLLARVIDIHKIEKVLRRILHHSKNTRGGA